MTRYVQVSSGQGGEKEYRLSATGELDWVRFVEPEERDSGPVEEHRHPPEPLLYGKDIPGLEGDYALNIEIAFSSESRQSRSWTVVLRALLSAPVENHSRTSGGELIRGRLQRAAYYDPVTPMPAT